MPQMVGTLLLPPPPRSRVCQDYCRECQAAFHRHINVELHASYLYLSMAFYFNLQEVAMKHFPTFFLCQCREAQEQIQTLMRLQNQREGASAWAISRGLTVAAEKAAGGPGNPPCKWRGW